MSKSAVRNSCQPQPNNSLKREPAIAMLSSLSFDIILNAECAGRVNSGASQLSKSKRESVERQPY
jgi:hypothetical protein